MPMRYICLSSERNGLAEVFAIVGDVAALFADIFGFVNEWLYLRQVDIAGAASQGTQLINATAVSGACF